MFGKFSCGTYVIVVFNSNIVVFPNMRNLFLIGLAIFSMVLSFSSIFLCGVTVFRIPLAALKSYLLRMRILLLQDRFWFKVIPLFCTAHPVLRITMLNPRWRRFFPLARIERTRAAFAELKLLFAIIMPQIGWKLPGLLSKNKKMKEMCVVPKSAVVFHFAAVELWNN